MYALTGHIKYDPTVESGNRTMFNPWWVIVTFSGDIAQMYTWFVMRRTGVRLQTPAWGAHISVVRGEEPADSGLWKKYDGAPVEVLIDPDVRTNGKHWWLRVHCEALKDMRVEMGLPREGTFNLHLTIGSPVTQHADNAIYALNNFVRFPDQ